MASAVLSEKRGGHSYEKDGTSDCKFGCKCWMGGFRSGGPDGIDPFGKCPNNPKNKEQKSSEKKVRLKDLPADRLVIEYRTAVRKTWENRGSGKKAGHDPLYQRELSLKRELLRRLEVTAESREEKTTAPEEDRSGGGGLFSGGGGQGGGMFSRG